MELSVWACTDVMLESDSESLRWMLVKMEQVAGTMAQDASIMLPLATATWLCGSTAPRSGTALESP
jgi:hypothetical protein